MEEEERSWIDETSHHKCKASGLGKASTFCKRSSKLPTLHFSGERVKQTLFGPGFFPDLFGMDD
jgi:hypothetical protein